jgi:formylglycine-generating enzyme required for sulfatase activity
VFVIVPEGRGVAVATGSVSARHDGSSWLAGTPVCRDCVVTAVDAGMAGGVERTTGRGFVVRADSTTVLHDVVPVIPSASGVVEIVAAPDGWWIATTAAGVAWTDGSSWQLNAMQTGALRDDHVYDIALDPRGGLWVATHLGVTRLWSHGAHSHGPADLIPDPRSLGVTGEAVWVGMHGGGIARLDRASGLWEIVVPSGGGAPVVVLAADRGHVLAGTGGAGLMHLGRRGIITRITSAHGLADDRITSLAVVPGPAVWAGSPGGVAVRIDHSGIGRFRVVRGVVAATDPAPALDADRITIPRSEFLMGSGSHRPDEAPERLVGLGTFEIHRHEVTNAQYARYVSATGAPRPAAWPAGRIATGEMLHPVAGVRAEEAAAYCAWLGMRLPTEAEWERAARGTDARIWPWGNTWEPTRANTIESGIGWTTPVGSYPGGAAPSGSLDMAGNVAEWVADYYDAGYYAVAPDVDPTGPAAVTNRVRRGGSWAADSDEARTSRRTSSHGSSPDLRAGFRCAG